MRNALLVFSASLLTLLILSACKDPGASGASENDPVPAETPTTEMRSLTIRTEAGSVTFQVPPDYTVHSAEEEPMDWNYALADPATGFDFGIRAEPRKPGNASEADLQAAYLASVHQMHDPKITSRPAPEPLPGHLYESEYWGTRLVTIKPGENVTVTIEFNARKLETLQQRASVINAVAASIREE